MDKKRTIQHISSKKRGRPKIRFNFWILVIIFFLSFASCFALYMVWANFDGHVLDESEDDSITYSTAEAEPQLDSEQTTDAAGSDTEVQEPAENRNSAVSYPVPQSDPVDASYLENCCLVTDQTLLGISDNTELKSVIGSEELNAANCNDVQVYSTYGNLKVYEIMQNKKPDILYIMLGSDIGISDTSDMISSYSTLVNNLHGYLPEMKIYIMQLPPKPFDTAEVTNEMINDYNNRLIEMARSAGVYCIDTNSVLKSGEGVLDGKYWDSENGSYNTDAYSKIIGYILTHTVE